MKIGCRESLRISRRKIECEEGFIKQCGANQTRIKTIAENLTKSSRKALALRTGMYGGIGLFALGMELDREKTF